MREYFAFQWHITDRCDQRCKHCYLFAEGHGPLIETPWEQLVRTLDNIERMADKMDRAPYLYITGGDPILHRHFWDLLTLVHSRGIPFTLMGNPFHLTAEVCRRMKALGCRKYQLSLDGLRETHDRFRKPGSFDATLAAIPLIREAGMHCAVMSTVSAANIDELPELIDLVVVNHVDIFAFGRYCPTSEDKAHYIGDPSVNQRSVCDGDSGGISRPSIKRSGIDFCDLIAERGWHIEPLHYRAFLDACWRKFEQYKDSGTTFNLKDHLLTLYLYERGLWTIPDGLDEDTIYDGCNCGNCHFTISAEGRLMACRRFDSYVGTVNEDMCDVFHGAKMNAYREHERFEKCTKCELLRFCRGCPAVAFGYTRNFYAPDPQCWKEV